MILILVPGDTPRLRYALDLVLGRVLGQGDSGNIAWDSAHLLRGM